MKEVINSYDAIIIGAGPAGMSAGIYTSRAGLNTLLIEKEAFGGKMIKTDIIENYPGFESISGFDLSMNMHNQVTKLGAKFEFGEVVSLNKNDDTFTIEMSDGKKFYSHSVIIATGTKENELEVPGEKELYGKGVSYCSVCDGALYKGKEVAVVGGGYSAAMAAIFLSKLVKKVYIIVRKNNFRTDKKYIEILKSKENIEFIMESTVEKINGVNFVESIDVKTKDVINQLKVSAIFPYIGSKPLTNLVSGFDVTNDEDYIEANDKMETRIPGLYVAGDARDVPLRQIAISVGDGAIAGQMITEYVQQIIIERK